MSARAFATTPYAVQLMVRLRSRPHAGAALPLVVLLEPEGLPMLISVVNASNGDVDDDEIQRVLPAVNRQIAEDFAPYWGRSATLRLEGRALAGSNAQDPKEIRGDAILYLVDAFDPDDPLGFHDLNARGIPFGVVFLDLARQLDDGEWSPTLSHEALELIRDPEVMPLTEQATRSLPREPHSKVASRH